MNRESTGCYGCVQDYSIEPSMFKDFTGETIPMPYLIAGFGVLAFGVILLFINPKIKKMLMK